jgi:CRISPR-associated protein Csm2
MVGNPVQGNSGAAGANVAGEFEKVRELVANLKEDYNTLHEKARNIASNIKINSTKLRKFYNHVKKIEVSGLAETDVEKILKRELNKFLAVLLYDVGREERNQEQLKELAEGMKKVVDVVKQKNGAEIKKAYNLFTDFFEALVAYHKYYEAMNNSRSR